MNCAERQDQILLYAAGQLEGDEAAELRAHLATGCPRCLGSLAEAQAVVAAIPLSLEGIDPPPQLAERLMQKIAAGPMRMTGAPPPADRADSRQMGRSLRAAIIGGALAALIAVVCTVAVMRAQTPQRMGGLTGVEDLRYVALSSDAQPGAHGRILWDADHHQWHVSVFRLQPPGPGKVYELWFITKDQKKIPGGTFNVDADGHASLVARIPSDIGPLALAAITDEPAPGVQSPTGKIQLVGKVVHPE